MPHKIMFAVLSIAVGWTMFIGCASFSSGSDELKAYRYSIEYCENMGRDAGSYQVYFECTVKLGLRDGGAQ